MAKKEKLNEEEVFEEVEMTFAEENETEKAPVADEVVVSATVKKVKIHTLEDVDSIISQIPYKIGKDKDAVVPSDVAAVLCFARKAYRL